MRLLRLKTRHKIALAGMASTLICCARWIAGRGPVVQVRRSGLQWQLDLREGIDLSIYLLGRFEWSTFRCYRRHLKPGTVAIDIGANIGAHTLPLATLVGPNGQVLAFEPTAYAYTKLRRNISLNPSVSDRVVPEQMVLTATDGETPPPSLPSSWPLSYEPTRNALHGGVSKGTAGARAGTLDTYLEEHRIGPVGFIKLDVDGHEFAVLDGASRTLTRDMPAISFEFAPSPASEPGRSALDLVARLLDLGYSVTREDDDRPMTSSAALAAVVPPGKSINLFALRRQQGA